MADFDIADFFSSGVTAHKDEAPVQKPPQQKAGQADDFDFFGQAEEAKPEEKKPVEKQKIKRGETTDQKAVEVGGLDLDAFSALASRDLGVNAPRGNAASPRVESKVEAAAESKMSQKKAASKKRDSSSESSDTSVSDSEEDEKKKASRKKSKKKQNAKSEVKRAEGQPAPTKDAAKSGSKWEGKFIKQIWSVDLNHSKTKMGLNKNIVTWRFVTAGDVQHTLQLQHSTFGGKRRIILDGRTVLSEKKFIESMSRHDVSGWDEQQQFQCTVIIKDQAVSFFYDLLIDSVPWSTALKSFLAANPSVKKQ